MNARNAILIGLLAGLAGGLMTLAGMRAGLAALPLMFAAPLAVYVASLGWGTVAGFLAAAVAILINAFDGALPAAAVTGVLLFLPAAWAGHLANLAQPDASGRGLEWYPLSRILAWLMAAVAAGFILTGWIAGIDAAVIADDLARALREIVAAQGDAPPQFDIDQAARLYSIVVIAVMPALWLTLHVLVFQIAAAVTRRSGRLARPAQDIAAEASLPPAALIVPVAGLAGMFLTDGAVREIAAVLAGVGIAGFALVGLAEIHFASRGRPGRMLLLIGCYLLIPLFSLALVVFAAIGARRSLRRAAAGGPNS